MAVMWLLQWVFFAAPVAPASGPYLGGAEGFSAHIQSLEAAAASREDDPEPPLRLAQGLGSRKQTEAALRWLRVAVERGADPLRVQLVAGDIHLAAEQYEFALNAYFEVASAAPENGYAHLRLWRVLREADILPPNVDAGRLKSYLRDAGYAIPDQPVRPPDTAMARQLTEQAYGALQAGRFQDATEGFVAALARDDAHAAAHRGLGIAYARQNQQGRALAAYRLYLWLAESDDRETRQVKRILSDAARRRGLAGPRKP